MQRRIVFIALCVAVVCALCISCNPNPPEEPVVIKEITQQSALEAVLEYFPYTADGSYTFINSQSGEKLRLTPFTQGSSSHKFPEVTSMKSLDEWDNIVNAEFNAEDRNNTYRTSQYCEICTAGDNFEVRWKCAIRLSLDEGYGGSIIDTHCDSLTFWKIHTDTLRLPINSKYNNRNRGDVYDVAGAYIRLVKGVGLYDFCIDGSSIWRRTDVTSK